MTKGAVRCSYLIPADGALLWEKRYNGPAKCDDHAQAVAVDGSGNVVVTGYSTSDVDHERRRHHDYYTAKYAAADGALLWEKRYNGPANGRRLRRRRWRWTAAATWW